MCNSISRIFSLHFFVIELLDEEEFGEVAESLTYDENSSNSAMELGLLVNNLNLEKEKLGYYVEVRLFIIIVFE